jgi:hypothetical protein
MTMYMTIALEKTTTKRIDLRKSQVILDVFFILDAEAPGLTETVEVENGTTKPTTASQRGLHV